MRASRVVALFPLLGCAAMQTPVAPAKTVVIPPGMARAYDAYHYAPAVQVGDTIIVSGVPAGGPGDYQAQIRRMFERVKAILEASGASMADVVELTTFHVAPRTSAEFQEEFGRFLPVHTEFFPDGYPAWTAVGTTALLAEGAVVEMRVVAVKGSGARTRVQRPDAGP